MPRTGHVAVLDGQGKMIVWGGLTKQGPTSTGGIYDYPTQKWTPTTLTNAPTERTGATAVWESQRHTMIVWGGMDAQNNALGDGARYDPRSDRWTRLEVLSAPRARYGHTATWIGDNMVVWGGENKGVSLDDGGQYDPVMGTWTRIPPAPQGRSGHTAIGDDTGILVWGGFRAQGAKIVEYRADGYLYDSEHKTWKTLPAGALSRRAEHSILNVAGGLLVYGGHDGREYRGDGAKFDLATASWAKMESRKPPVPPRAGHTAVRLGNYETSSLMMIWGGKNDDGFLGDGYIYDDTNSRWDPLPPGPQARAHHTAVVIMGYAESGTIVWGGDTKDGPTNTGAIFYHYHEGS